MEICIRKQTWSRNDGKQEYKATTLHRTKKHHILKYQFHSSKNFILKMLTIEYLKVSKLLKAKD